MTTSIIIQSSILSNYPCLLSCETLNLGLPSAASLGFGMFLKIVNVSGSLSHTEYTLWRRDFCVFLQTSEGPYPPTCNLPLVFVKSMQYFNG